MVEEENKTGEKEGKLPSVVIKVTRSDGIKTSSICGWKRDSN